MPNPGGLGPAELPDWAPLTWNVATYVPHRTLVLSLVSNTQGQDVYKLTFDDTTRPTGDQVSQLIADGISWVMSRVTPLATVSQPTAALISCLYSAAMIERSWPDDDSSLQRALDFEKRMDLMLTGLIASNDLANNPPPVPGDDDYGLDVAPVWSFPPADTRYDNAGYW